MEETTMKKITLSEETYNKILNLATIPMLTDDTAFVEDSETEETYDLIKLLKDLNESLLKEAIV